MASLHLPRLRPNLMTLILPGVSSSVRAAHAASLRAEYAALPATASSARRLAACAARKVSPRLTLPVWRESLDFAPERGVHDSDPDEAILVPVGGGSGSGERRLFGRGGRLR